jgi:hypothetical protein
VLCEHDAVVRAADPQLLHRPLRIAHHRDLRAPEPQDAAGEGGNRRVGLDEKEVHARQRALQNMTAA